MDRCDQIRQSALAFAVEFAGGSYSASAGANLCTPEGVVGAAEVFHKFLLGAPQSQTAAETEEMEAVIRNAEAAAAYMLPESRTYEGANVEAANG